MDGLIIKEPYATWILKGEKTIELRSSNTNKRGTIAIIKSGTSNVYGIVDIVDSFEIETVAQYNKLRERHCVGAERKDIRYKRVWAWVLEKPVLFEEPVHYTPKIGQQIWVKDALKEEGKEEELNNENNINN